jgi:hypothetical protein
MDRKKSCEFKMFENKSINYSLEKKIRAGYNKERFITLSSKNSCAYTNAFFPRLTRLISFADVKAKRNNLCGSLINASKLLVIANGWL